MPLTQLQRDLQGFAENKLYNLIRDTTQAFEIAGRQRDAMACLVAMFMKAAAMIVVQVYGADPKQRQAFLDAAARMFDGETEDLNPDNERND